MFLTTSFLMATHLLVSPLHHVDFQIAPGQQGRAADAIESGRPSTPRGRDEIVSETRYNIARGFGNQVPVGFAVRQIVPAPFRVAMQMDLDPAITVSWTGGRPWNQVLWSALHARGLHMTVVRDVVTIRK